MPRAKYIKVGVTQEEHRTIDTTCAARGTTFQAVGYRLFLAWLSDEKLGDPGRAADSQEGGTDIKWNRERHDLHAMLDEIMESADQEIAESLAELIRRYFDGLETVERPNLPGANPKTGGRKSVGDPHQLAPAKKIAK